MLELKVPAKAQCKEYYRRYEIHKNGNPSHSGYVFGDAESIHQIGQAPVKRTFVRLAPTPQLEPLVTPFQTVITPDVLHCAARTLLAFVALTGTLREGTMAAGRVRAMELAAVAVPAVKFPDQTQKLPKMPHETGNDPLVTLVKLDVRVWLPVLYSVANVTVSDDGVVVIVIPDPAANVRTSLNASATRSDWVATVMVPKLLDVGVNVRVLVALAVVIDIPEPAAKVSRPDADAAKLACPLTDAPVNPGSRMVSHPVPFHLLRDLAMHHPRWLISMSPERLFSPTE